jgi:acyl-CoA synthetase (AMP-forming)/AMP-acid ligase II
MTHTSLAAVLSVWADSRGDERALTFVNSAGVDTHATYGELDQAARTVAGYLRGVLSPHDRVLLLIPPGDDYVTAFLGCLYAGVVAVPLYPPGPTARFDRVIAAARDCGAVHALTAADFVAMPGRPHGLVVHTVEAARRAAKSSGPQRSETGDVAFLQYTSGSTGDPKGVMVSHGNLTANHEAITAGFGIDRNDVVLSWLPTYHDMGLIGTTLLPLREGIPAILLDTLAFIRDPLIWAREISRFRATCSGGPDFAYRLMTERFAADHLDGIDLSSWRIAFNGAEPVQRRTLDTFAATYRPLGFDHRALYPCYGLAEATLFVSGPKASTGYRAGTFTREAFERGWLTEASGAADTGSTTLVSCGTPPPGTTVVLRRADGELCAEGEIGEILVSSAGVAGGYWGRSDSADTFGATVQGHPGAFLSTGDLGARYDGELFVTGRLKDLIVRAGRNYHPHDLEAVGSADDSLLRQGRAAAFQLDSEGHRVVMVVEASGTGLTRLRNDPTALTSLISALRRRVAAGCALDLDEVAVVMPGSIPRTSSGKIQRRATREQFLEGRLKPVKLAALRPAEPPAPHPDHDRAAVVVRLVEQYTGLDASRLDHRLPLAALGLTSLRLIELKAAVERVVNGTLSPDLFFGDRSLAELLTGMADAQLAPIPLPARAGGEGPASAGQVELQFYDELHPSSRANYLSVGLRLSGQVDEEVLRAAIKRAVARHGALRTTLGPLGSSVQIIADRVATDWQCRTFAEGADEECREFLSEAAHRSMDLLEGPLVRAAVAYQPNSTVLVLVCHHVVVDHWSLQLLLAEILPQITGEDLAAQPGPQVPNAVDWARVQQRARLDPGWTDRVRTFADRWQTLRQAVLFPEPASSGAGPRRRDPDPHRAGWLDLAVKPDVALLLRRYAARRGVTPFVPLLAAYVGALHHVTGERHIVIGVPHHGRSDQRFSATVGYLVNMMPVLGDLSDNPTPPVLEDRLWRELRLALATADVPFSELVRVLAADRHSQNPLFQVSLTLHQAVSGDHIALSVPWRPYRSRIGSRDVETFDIPPTHAAFAVSLYAFLDHSGMAFRLVHQLRVVPQELAAEIGRRFLGSIDAVVRDPDNADAT